MNAIEFKSINKLHVLLRLALDDLKKVEAMSDKYEVNMRRWHEPESSTGKCLVCAAGAVMACTLNAPIDEYRELNSFDDNEIKLRLDAVDDLRLGLVSWAMQRFGYESDCTERYNRTIPDYEEDKEGFHREMEELYNELKEADL